MRPRPIVGPLMPPNTPPDLPYGLQRGGIFDAGYVPPTYIDANRVTVPTDSPATHNVSQDIYRRPVPFFEPNAPRQITSGVGQLPMVLTPALGRTGVRGAAAPRHRVSAWSSRPWRSHVPMHYRRHAPIGQFQGTIPGMGWQPGDMLVAAGPPPLPIPGWSPVARPHGTTEGGIFGQGHVIEGMATGARVPGVRHRDVLIERTVRPLGASPDGLG